MTSKTKSRHRIPTSALGYRAEPISERYWTEVWASTARLDKQHRKALKALEAAERRAERARKALEAAKSRAGNRQAQRALDRLSVLVDDRRRELAEIEKLMIPDDYSCRDAKLRTVRHEAGAILVPLGGTTGEPPKRLEVPTFPVTVRPITTE